MIKINNYPNLIKNETTGLIINIDNEKLTAYKTQFNIIKQQQNIINTITKELQELKEFVYRNLKE